MQAKDHRLGTGTEGESRRYKEKAAGLRGPACSGQAPPCATGNGLSRMSTDLVLNLDVVAHRSGLLQGGHFRAYLLQNR